jgi:hypothetical protein
MTGCKKIPEGYGLHCLPEKASVLVLYQDTTLKATEELMFRIRHD